MFSFSCSFLYQQSAFICCDIQFFLLNKVQSIEQETTWWKNQEKQISVEHMKDGPFFVFRLVENIFLDIKKL